MTYEELKTRVYECLIDYDDNIFLYKLTNEDINNLSEILENVLKKLKCREFYLWIEDSPKLSILSIQTISTICSIFPIRQLLIDITRPSQEIYKILTDVMNDEKTTLSGVTLLTKRPKESL